jgi:hypothetical protein
MKRKKSGLTSVEEIPKKIGPARYPRYIQSGLVASELVWANVESPAEFHSFEAHMLAILAPNDDYERILADDVIAARWNLRKYMMLESTFVEQGDAGILPRKQQLRLMAKSVCSDFRELITIINCMIERYERARAAYWEALEKSGRFKTSGELEREISKLQKELERRASTPALPASQEETKCQTKTKPKS